MAAKKRSNDVPAGFSEVDNSMVGFWKPDQVGQSLQGVVGAMRETTGAEGKANRYYAIRITNSAKTIGVETSEGKPLEVDEGDLVGVGGAILNSFLIGREGQEVYLVYKGLGPKKKGRNPAKLFATYAKDHDAETGEVTG